MFCRRKNRPLEELQQKKKRENEQKAWNEEWSAILEEARREAKEFSRRCAIKSDINLYVFDHYRTVINTIFEDINKPDSNLITLAETFGHTDFGRQLRSYQNALLDELDAFTLSPKRARHVVDTARALQQVNRSAKCHNGNLVLPQQFSEDLEVFHKKAVHSGLRPRTKMLGSLVCSNLAVMALGVGLFFLACACPLAGVTIAGIILCVAVTCAPISTGLSCVSYRLFNPIRVAENEGRKVTNKLRR